MSRRVCLCMCDYVGVSVTVCVCLFAEWVLSLCLRLCKRVCPMLKMTGLRILLICCSVSSKGAFYISYLTWIGKNWPYLRLCAFVLVLEMFFSRCWIIFSGLLSQILTDFFPKIYPIKRGWWFLKKRCNPPIGNIERRSHISYKRKIGIRFTIWIWLRESPIFTGIRG